MPFTPYHFGPSGFIGLVFKRWLDLPVFVLANVVVDFEVPFKNGLYPHRVWHFHTLLIGAVAGATFGLAVYPLRGVFKWAMKLLRLPYRPTLFKMVISGIFGVWLPVVIDAVYHWDVQLLWPIQNARPLWNVLSQNQVRATCLILWGAAFALYLLLLATALRKERDIRKPQTPSPPE